jgi:hypothetical protein
MVPIAPNVQVLVPNRTVYDGSGIAQTSGQVASRLVSNAATRTWVTVIWAGHNNFRLGTSSQVRGDIAFMVSTLQSFGNNHFVIMSLLNEDTPGWRKGEANYAAIMQLNADLAATYPNNYLDVRTPLVNSYNPAIAQDVIDHNNDVVPSSLRYDEAHLRQEGSAFVAAMIRDFIVARGW